MVARTSREWRMGQIDSLTKSHVINASSDLPYAYQEVEEAFEGYDFYFEMLRDITSAKIISRLSRDGVRLGGIFEVSSFSGDVRLMLVATPAVKSLDIPRLFSLFESEEIIGDWFPYSITTPNAEFALEDDGTVACYPNTEDLTGAIADLKKIAKIYSTKEEKF